MAHEKYVTEFEDKDGVVYGVMDEEAREEVSAKAPAIVQEASGNVVTIADGVDGAPVSAVVQIVPVQNFNGYERPFPPGGGRNLLDPSAYTPAEISPIYNSDGELVEGTRSGIYINLAPGTYTMKQNAIGTQYTRGNVLDGNNGFVSYFALSTTSVASAKTFTIAEGEKLCLFRGTTTSGSLNLNTSKFMLESGSEGHAYEPYKNICPISGWTGCKINHARELVSGNMTVENGFYDNSGTPTSSTATRRTPDYMPSVPGVTYMITGTCDSDGAKVRVHEYDASQTWLRQVYISEGIPIGEKVYQMWTASEDAAYYRISWPKLTSADSVKIYSYAEQYSVAFPDAAGTVYGGTLTVHEDGTGTLVTNWKARQASMADVGTWYMMGSGTSKYFRYKCDDLDSSDYHNALSNVFPYGFITTDTTEIGLRAGSASGNPYVFVRPPNVSGMAVADFKAYLKGLETTYGITLQVIYKTTATQTYELTAEEVGQILMGANPSTFWADTGDIALTYQADTKAYITKVTDPDGNVIQVTGSTPSITGESGKRYVCGTVDSISITPPSTGIVDIVFSSGTTPAVLTVPSSVKFPGWFNSASLDASTKYEINIMDGTDGVVMAWPT